MSATKGPSPVFGLILAILIPPVGLLLSLWALVALSKNHQRGKTLAIIGVAIGLILTSGLVLLYAVLFSLGGGGHANQAQGDMKPVEAEMEKLGGQKLCKNGDNGYTLDNTEPWYTVYYAVGGTGDITQSVKNAASAAGHPLTVNAQRATDLQTGNNVGYPNNETYSANNDYLASDQAAKGRFVVEIIRDGQISLDCDTGTYGEAKSPPPNGAIVMLSLSLPSTQ